MESSGFEAVPAGAEVVDIDGERLGSVVAAADTYIVVERGFFFPTDTYIPRSAISELMDGMVHLNVTRAHVLAQGWQVDPHPPESENTAGPTIDPAPATV